MDRFFYNSYIGFGVIMRTIFIDFIGPLIPLISYFWIIRSEDDLECGGLKYYELYRINYIYLLITNIPQMIVVISMMIRYRK